MQLILTSSPSLTSKYPLAGSDSIDGGSKYNLKFTITNLVQITYMNKMLDHSIP